MIRPAVASDIDDIVSLWLDASIEAHNFIDQAWWKARAQDMRELYLPLSDILVVAIDDECGHIVGFMALIENFLAALFVRPGWQRQGIGSRLLDLARKLRPDLYLSVYAKNHRAVAFYRQHGFCIRSKRIEDATGQCECVMALPAA